MKHFNRNPTFCAVLAALTIPLAAPCMQQHQQNHAATTHKTPGAPSIAFLSDGWDAMTPNTAPTNPQSHLDVPTPSITFTFNHPGVPIPRYTLALWQNAQGHYHGEQAASTTPSEPPPPPQPFDTTFAISPATTAKIFALSTKLKHFTIPCASQAKNIASTGTKTLRYTAPDTTTSSCTYDYSENKDVQQLTQILQSITDTMDQGRHMDFLHRYDRLGLDQAITTLATEARTGQALELATIAPTLQSIADDPEVLQRVRTRAAALLSTIPAAPPPP